jgi:phage host-nuclease inhibitor protein Gam
MTKSSGNINPQVGQVGGQQTTQQEPATTGKVSVDKTALSEAPQLPDPMLLDLVQGPKAKFAPASADGNQNASKLSPEVQLQNKFQLLRGMQMASTQNPQGAGVGTEGFLRQASDKLGLMLLHASNQTSEQLATSIGDMQERLGSLSDHMTDFMANHSEELAPETKKAALELKSLIESANDHAAHLADDLKGQSAAPDEKALQKAGRLKDALGEIAQKMKELSLPKMAIRQLGDMQTALDTSMNRLQEMQANVDKKIASVAKDTPAALLNFTKAGKEMLDGLMQNVDDTMRGSLPKSVRTALLDLKKQLKEWQNKFTALDASLKKKNGLKESIDGLKKDGSQYGELAQNCANTLAQILLSAQLFSSETSPPKGS